MNYRTLPNTDLRVSEIAFGAWGIVGDAHWGPQDEKDAIAALQTAYEMGINFFDTAEAYGDGASEHLIDRALADVRDKIIIATKLKPEDFAYQDVKKACEQRLKALQTEQIDLLQLHWPNHNVPLQETIRALEDLLKEGKIRAFGVSNFGVGDLHESLLVSGAIATNQLPYSLLWRAIEYEILPLCHQKNVAILCYSPLMQGLLTGKFATPDEVPDGRARSRHFSKNRPKSRHQEEGAESVTFDTLNAIQKIAQRLDIPMGQLSVAWLLGQPNIGSVIVGGRNAAQVRDNAMAAHVKLSSETMSELNKVTAQLKAQLGPNPDLWQSESRYR